ncbi:UbiA family prenyltransferase [Methanosphaerula palustris]|uniref:UbiA prenyltransferase n=1 Tax=Methanosphaerula palustris (strain ATCC BAA-1556 / DSM 19958 / E1-9c) TaxID=521011 RepID=B8GHR6_METPE|nr:UbiA family prenyltransferase [Methanosphaerula palustris]ACL16671.1 UbiA prenyltransferase [Methanosphaerula palustris E1-9c]
MRLSISTKIRASGDLIRMDLALGAGIFFVAGEILAIGGLPPVNQVLLGFLTLFFISGSANISNDYFDRDVDSVNLPTRPLPSGRISIPELWLLFLLFTAAGLTTAAFLGPLVLALVSVFWGIALLYNIRLKNFGFAGNLVVAVCVAMTVTLGGIAVGTINGVVLTFAALAFLFDLGEEIASDAMDVEGDQLRSSKSLAKRWGRTTAIRITGVMFAVFCLLTLLPFLMGWLGIDYLFLGAVMDLWTISCLWSLMRSRTEEEGREQIRRLYLAWGLFVIVFAITRIL